MPNQPDRQEHWRDSTPSIGFPQKHLANPLFKQDKAWEPRIDNGYPNAFIGADGKTMELYYGTCQKDCSVQLLLFANSTDGIRWLKPNLGIYDIARVRPDLKAIGRRNNVLCEGGGIGVMRDAGRYIAFGPGCYLKCLRLEPGLRHDVGNARAQGGGVGVGVPSRGPRLLIRWPALGECHQRGVAIATAVGLSQQPAS